MKVKRRTLAPAAGVSPAIGFLLAGMEEVRGQLREAVEELSDEEIARRFVPETHAIGALVLHIGEAEWWWTNCIIQGHKVTDEDSQQAFWDVLEDPDGFAAKGYSASYCLETIAAIGEKTRRFLSSLNDNDLENVYRYTRGETTIEASLRWILHHLIDHEAQHKGQILMLKRLNGSKTKDWI